MKPNPVKRALKAGQPAVGTWLSLGSITASRFMLYAFSFAPEVWV